MKKTYIVLLLLFLLFTSIVLIVVNNNQNKNDTNFGPYIIQNKSYFVDINDNVYNE